MSVSNPAKTGSKQDGRFPKGVSGNPQGRPQGSRNRASIAIEELLEGQAEKLTKKCIDKALKGDMAAMRLCLDRLCPPRKGRPIDFDAPLEIRSAADAIAATGGLVSALAAGKLTADEASAASAVISNFAKLLEIAEIEARLAALEARTQS